MFKVSQSKIKLWRRCKKAYDFRYNEKLRAKSKSRPLEFGSIVHEMLEAHANQKDPMKVLARITKERGKLFAAEREKFGDILEDVRDIMTEYFDHYADDNLRHLRINGKRAEHEFTLEIDPGIELTLIMDGIVRTDDFKFLLEHKTTKSDPPDAEELWMNLQSGVYVRANDMLGRKPIDGVMWNYISSKKPTVPEITKKGEFSKKKINTFARVLHRHGEEHGIKVPQELLDRAQETPAKYFHRFPVPVDTEAIDHIFTDFVTDCRDARDRGHELKTMNIDKHCKFCDYKSLCRAMLTGSDVDFVKEREYEKISKKKETRGTKGKGLRDKKSGKRRSKS